jgi:putative Holliday junction resolvase
MRILAIDWGQKNIGLAIGEELANELTTVPNNTALIDIERICKTEEVNKIIIGYPLRSNGENGTHNQQIDKFIEDLQKVCLNIEIEKIDEAYSSVEARKELESIGLKDEEIAKRIDQYSAKIILADYIHSQGF